MDDLFDDILQEIIQQVSEITSDIDVGEIISNAHNSFPDLFSSLSEFSLMTDDVKETIINSIIEDIGGNHDTIVENLSFVSNLDSDSFCGIQSDNFSSIPSDFSNDSIISFCGNSDEIEYQEEILRQAKHDIEYYEKEIRNFSEKTSATYRSICNSRLNQAIAKAKEVARKIQELKKKLE